MDAEEHQLQQELHKDFLKTLHEEKLKTQAERTTYTSSKLAFVTGLFGVGSLKIGGIDLHWLLYLIPLVAIGYDLYIRAADSSIKKMGAFLRSESLSGTSKSEQAWEQFSAQFRDRLAPLANALFTCVVTTVAAIYVYVQTSGKTSEFWVGFVLWLSICQISNIGLWWSYGKSDSNGFCGNSI